MSPIELTTPLDVAPAEEFIGLFIDNVFAAHRAETRIPEAENLEEAIVLHLEADARFAAAQYNLADLVETLDE